MAVSFNRMLTKIFGSRNERLLKRYRAAVAQINALEPRVRAMTDPQLRARTLEIRAQLTSGKARPSEILQEAFAIIRESMDRNIGIRTIFDPEAHFDPNKLDDEMLQVYDQVQQQLIATGESWGSVPIPPKLYDAVRALYPESRPPFRARCFDVQLIGGLVLYEGKIAEMATGEGKTFVAPLACFMRVLEGNHAHVVTVNDYLVRRDSNWIRPAFENLGLSVSFIQSDMEPGGDARRQAYGADVTYGTNSEFGFDFLRDNMKERAALQVQGPLQYVIVDEVDSILIDEARTPLIISGAAHDDAAKYRAADVVARKVMELNKPWDAVESQCDTAKRQIKAAEGDEEKAKNKADREAAKARRRTAEQDLAEAEGKKAGLVQYYEVELDRKSAHLTHEGIAAAQEIAGVGSFFVGNNMEWPHLMEQAMRAHVVYERDKDYVVERGSKGTMEVVIVDEFTGRKMQGRQWSDGLHQAVEAKERVPIKEETQTLATITLQNFFKMYKARAGMTGTAQTEAEEFAKIYRLDVVTIPTNRPVQRLDHEDRVYRTEGEKWEAIIQEIKEVSDLGRPVLVGTTSVEKSEMLSTMLKRKYGVDHEVLNAKQHEREAHIVALAGEQHRNPHGELVGNVTIATNMAGRGTDIKPAQTAFYEVVHAPGERERAGGKYELLQRGGDRKVEVPAPTREQLKNGEIDERVNQLQLKPGAKVVGGLHVIGTERHTARRIDNQLRGRSGRQGDPGSSRFYVSLQDDLMKMFAGDWTIKVLGWLGMEEGMAIEDKRISKGILRAQKKVEERNFLARKNLIEYDEVMDHQRNTFYGMRQRVLVGKDVDQVIWDMIGEAIADAVNKYISEDFLAATVVEWTRVNFETSLETSDFRGLRQLSDLERFIKDKARAEAETNITATLGEFTGEEGDEDSSRWDVKGLQSWAKSRFHVDLSPGQIRQMSLPELEDTLRRAAVEQIDQRDVAGLTRYLEPLYAQQELANWARDKFGIEITPQEMLLDERTTTAKPVEEIVELIEKRARAAYARREVDYPIEHTLAYAYGGPQGSTDNPYAAEFLRDWTFSKFRVQLATDHIRASTVLQLRDELTVHQQRFLHEGGLEKTVDELIAQNKDLDALRQAANDRFALKLEPRDFEIHSEMSADDGRVLSTPMTPEQVRETLMQAGRRFFRRELTDLEQFVLIQIFDQSWKDHLYAMDMLKAGIGLLGFAEQDPRVQYKKEGFGYFQQMMAGVRDKVTDLIFRARIVGAQQQTKSAYKETQAIHQDAGGYGVSENVAATAAVLGDAPQPSQSAEGQAQSQGGGLAVKPIVRDAPKVGRNDPCPCGSGKKYKKCCGAHAA